MIELHTHIIPKMDDGAKDIEEANHMLDILENQGVRTVVLTPHFYPRERSLEDFLAKRKKRSAVLHHDQIQFLLGSETMLDDFLFHYEDIQGLCIEGTSYLLLELSYRDKWSSHYFDDIERLMERFDVIPIIAHIERYASIKQYYKLIYDLKDMGCMIQMNAGSIVAKWDRLFAMKLLKKGLIDVVSSDCHNMTSRKPIYRDAMEIITAKFGVDYVKKLESNAQSIIENRVR